MNDSQISANQTYGGRGRQIFERLNIVYILTCAQQTIATPNGSVVDA